MKQLLALGLLSQLVACAGTQGSQRMGRSDMFRVTESGDLNGPLQLAFLKACSDGRATFTVEFAPGTYKGPLDLTDFRDNTPLALTVIGVGSPPAVITDGSVQLNAASVRLENIVIDHDRASASLIRIHVEKSAILEHIAVIDSIVQDVESIGAIVDLRATRGGKPTALIKDSWFVRNKSASGRGATLELTGNSNWDFATVELDNVVFAGNETTYSILPSRSLATRLRDVVFYEPNVSQALTSMESPLDKISIEGGILAGAKKAINYPVGGDLKRSDYQPASMTGTTVRLAAPIPTEDALQTNVRTLPEPAAPAWDAVMAAARRGEKPSAAKLGL